MVPETCADVDGFNDFASRKLVLRLLTVSDKTRVCVWNDFRPLKLYGSFVAVLRLAATALPSSSFS